MNENRPKWQKIASKMLYETRVFNLHVQRLRSSQNSYEDDFYYFEVVDWVNIIPLTPENEVVMVSQYRFGIHDYCLEIPGGMLDDKAEDPMSGALRELQEETGYTAKEIEQLGYVHPNPAIQNNRLISFIAKDVKLECKQDLDPAEDITVHLVPLREIPALITSGKITHSLVISAFCMLFSKSL